MRIARITCEKTESNQDKVNLELLNPLIEKYKGKRGNLIPLLQGAQSIFGYLPREVFIRLSDATGIKLSDMYGVVTFYAQFRLNPVGRYILKVCHGTACHVQNANVISDAIREALNIKDGETTADRFYTLESVACLGCCSLAPVMMIGDDTFGKLTGSNAVKIIKEIQMKESN
jgi:NADH-quinone oxidoreductase subunit E